MRLHQAPGSRQGVGRTSWSVLKPAHAPLPGHACHIARCQPQPFTDRSPGPSSTDRSPTPFNNTSKISPQPLYNIAAALPATSPPTQHAMHAMCPPSPSPAPGHSAASPSPSPATAQHSGSPPMHRPRPRRWLLLLRLLLGQLGRLAVSLAVSFCLVVLMLMRPRAAAAAAGHSAPNAEHQPASSCQPAAAAHTPQSHPTHCPPQRPAPSSIATGWVGLSPQSQPLSQLVHAQSQPHHLDPTHTPAPATTSSTADLHSQPQRRTRRRHLPLASLTLLSTANLPSQQPANSQLQPTAGWLNPVTGQLAEAQGDGAASGSGAHNGDGQGADTGASSSSSSSAPQPMLLSGPALLAAQEAAVTSLFKSTQGSVVNISGARAAGTFSSLDVSRACPGQCSGVVWDERGHVITSYSCVRGAAEVKVTFADASTFTAKLVGFDAGKDVAVLRLSMPKSRLKELIPVKLPPVNASSASLAVGSSVWALGNATGLDHTMTQGIVSGLGREVAGAAPYPLKGLIQTDAASGHQAGGLLINSQGRMVGMVVAPGQGAGRPAGYAMGFALPVETMKGLVNQILATGRPSRPTLGVTLAPPQVLAAHGVEGVLVLEVPPGSPAAIAGLRHTHRDIFGDVILGDVIVGIEATPVRSVGDLYAALDTRKAGDRVRVDILRDGKATSLTLVLGDRGAAGALEE